VRLTCRSWRRGGGSGLRSRISVGNEVIKKIDIEETGWGGIPSANGIFSCPR